MSENKYLQWLSSETPTKFWHDSAVCSEQIEAFENGAVGMTTNPFLISATILNDRKFWEEKFSAIPRDLTGNDKVIAIMKKVSTFYSKQLMPLYEKNSHGDGLICVQVDPTKTWDAEFMIAQAKEFIKWFPNIVIKLPATNAGLIAYEECVALGFNVAATLSFTLPQVLAAGAARERGKKRALANGVKPGLAIAVMMVGRLDDYLRDVVHDSGLKIKEEDIIQAGVACMKKAYKIFQERQYDAVLMPSGGRGANHVTEFSGADMILSISPKVAKELVGINTFEERIQCEVSKETINRLMEMKEFRKAYEVDGLKADEFITFGSTNRTTTQFIECGWNTIASFNL